MTDDEANRKQWRGKIRVSERSNANGDVQYLAEYKRRWYLEWVMVQCDPPTVKRNGRVYHFAFPSLDAARIAAQLAWNKATAYHAENLNARFSAWRKVWP